MNFMMNTLPKPVLTALLYRLVVLHFASQILPTIGADSWESDGDPSEVRPVWWRWMNIFFTLVLWAVELIVSNDEDAVTKSWKVE
ncbi:hypothetical protein EIP86_004456 [Pleurotus ostreatoroseus]|nr:hypothetical protein EIP86_004456 [Pleurotus ostreatoroseus]